MVTVTQRSHIVETESFGDTFGPKAQRKRPRIEANTFAELSKLGSEAYDAAASATLAAEMSSLDPFAPSTSSLDPSSSTSFSASHSTPNANAPHLSTSHHPQTHADYTEPIFSKGTSRRIYGELYKVIDSSDVVLHVLDARDPMGTMCESVLEYVRREKAHKQVVLVINKCDLVPGWVTVCTLPRSQSHSLAHQFIGRLVGWSAGWLNGWLNVHRPATSNTSPPATQQSPSTPRRTTPSAKAPSSSSSANSRSSTRTRNRSRSGSWGIRMWGRVV